ncbi:SMP-30/gluconolactonase/LRE family protein [Nocardiopsis coralliicola]
MHGDTAGHEASVVLDGYSFLEGPRWHGGRLWLSDFYTGQVVAAGEQGPVEVMAAVPEQPSGLGFLPDGRVLIVSMRDRRILVRAESGELSEYADLSAQAPGLLNDLIVDGAGRAYVGNFGFDLMGGAPMRSASLLRVDPDGTVATAAEDLVFPNGMAILPGGVLLVAETFGGRITAFDTVGDGTLHGRREWARFGPLPQTDDAGAAGAQLPVGPDGICADAEGAVWVADALHNRAVRVREGGEITDEIRPGTGVFACMLGGSDGRTLYLCTAPSFAEHERRATREARLLAVRVDVPRGGLP